MKNLIPFYVFLMHESDVKQGQTWTDVGIRYGFAMLEHHGAGRLEWLNAHSPGWKFRVHTHHLPRTAMSAAHEPSVRLGVDLEFTNTASAVLYKLTWGKGDSYAV